jgi:hypothetical protein
MRAVGLLGHQLVLDRSGGIVAYRSKIHRRKLVPFIETTRVSESLCCNAANCRKH